MDLIVVEVVLILILDCFEGCGDDVDGLGDEEE